MAVRIDRPPVVKVKIVCPVNKCPCLGYQVRSELETTTNAAGKIVREIVHPCAAIDPTADSVFRAVDDEGIDPGCAGH
jgi:hypothetical protein